MSDTWTDILDAGLSTGLPVPFDRSRHDQIWVKETLLEAFIGAQQELASVDLNCLQERGLDRNWVHGQVK